MKLFKLPVVILTVLIGFAYGCNKHQDSNTYSEKASVQPGSVNTDASKPSVSFKINNKINDSTLLEANLLDFQVIAKNAVSYHWDFGDGQTSTDKVPVFFYTSCSSKFNVSLTVANSRGETAVYTQPFWVMCCRGFNNHPPVTEPTHFQ